MSRINEVKELLQTDSGKNGGLTAKDVSLKLHIDRSTASRYLNALVKQNNAVKVPGKPVKYIGHTPAEEEADLIDLEGIGKSLRPILEQGMAALLYPSRNIPILLTGETGTGKTYLAETLCELAKKRMSDQGEVPFVAFNCADYAQNAELLVGQIFGIKEGAFTGAIEDRVGLVEKANGGILFLDEIHRLPPSGQEMLFYLMDKGIYRVLGEATKDRYANITIIGATTEDPHKALLPALVRRFSIKLTLPSLKERTRKEREELVNHFLKQEANKMDTSLAITDNSREALLHYPCPGNIGQLKSDIQIACAHAYLRYLNKHEEKVIIQIADLPDNIASFANSLSFDQQEVTSTIESEKKISEHLPNIYQKIASQEDYHSIHATIKKYISDLSKKYRQPHFVQQGWQQLIDEDLFHALSEAKSHLSYLPLHFNNNQLYVIGLHLQNYRNHQYEAKKELPIVTHPNPIYREAAQQLAAYLNTTIGLQLPKEEIALLAHFLTTDEKNTVHSEQSIAVILVTHGASTASSMAEVTNTLLGNKVIQAIDMPLHVSATEIYQHVKQKISAMTHIKGALLLVDIGSLITMGDAIQHELDVEVKTLSSVNLPMVLEAGRKSLISNMSLEEIYHDTKKAMTIFVKEKTTYSPAEKKRMITTVCFTGEGAAQLLESWIEDQLADVDEDVLIRSVRIDPTTKDTSILEELKQHYDIVAIIGTVPVTIEGVPYIPAWELLQEEGISRMTKLLEVTRKSPKLREGDIKRNEIFPLVSKGLAEIVTYINPQSLATILNEYMEPIAAYYKWDVNRKLGMWMHIGSLMDRLVGAKLQNNMEQLLSSVPIDRKFSMDDEEMKVWEPLFTKLEATYHLPIYVPLRKALLKLSR
ncbi:sigma 54-interacting transcriptional regulator [Virgibacillus pantothenticus]|uniref:sigma 54-interacting transcriptional regulator n=1 Tax=Virgibacillus pantothenticus TaxID=1473 RepID=UPI001C24B18D|nr:sigma 54-interacting transcriptional regulator [Virgibacillus pantothenticus]MBU8567206.1 sigma 54-interacting transcriptional regulator [Virgibacillus pantothenticus]MBU8599963.1 sigma 54-interacting transcriptional regulator [Virgibacillus pantothenticus]MBU8635456.1 sigma 54-interacting transcriptional regulator [Virgibacillus pantothenticus]MBU8642257.1 sigma 54-interacting transcriptional regulator [Virgibacillus pantothenticus]MBU8646304.1 sigma 54-interacting transcriptional regulato